jgi:hypothetical protein
MRDTKTWVGIAVVLRRQIGHYLDVMSSSHASLKASMLGSRSFLIDACRCGSDFVQYWYDIEVMRTRTQKFPMLLL